MEKEYKITQNQREREIMAKLTDLKYRIKVNDVEIIVLKEPGRTRQFRAFVPGEMELNQKISTVVYSHPDEALQKAIAIIHLLRGYSDPIFYVVNQ